MEAQHWFGAITAMDEQVGRLREHLRELDSADNTLVWFCSDNGPSYIHDFNSAGPFRGKKGTLFEGGIRVPAIVEWPAVLKSPGVVETPCVTSDFYPTILALLDIEMENQPVLDGLNILPILEGKATERREPIAFQSPMRGQGAESTSQRQLALSDNRYKILSLDDGKSYELYDLLEDPSETRDIAGQHPEILGQMKEQLTAWCRSCRESLEGKDYVV
jgi:arylsulfatase A-like enzyme